MTPDSLPFPAEWGVFLALGVISSLLAYPKRDIAEEKSPSSLRMWGLFFGSLLTGFSLYHIVYSILSR